MIKINLLPSELKPKHKKPGIDLGSKETLYFIPVVFGVLVVIHIILGGVFLVKTLQVNQGKTRLQALEKQIKAVENLYSGTLQLSADAKGLSEIVSKSIKWAPKLNKLSLGLPAGVWFKSISLSAKALDIRASVISLEQNEMAIINQLIDNLKKDGAFFNDFAKFDLGSVDKRAIGSYDIADFNLIGVLKDK